MDSQINTRPRPFSVEKAIGDSISGIGAVVQDTLSDGEEYVRKEPVLAVGYALLGGYLLRFFPVMSLLRAIVCLLLALIRPLALVYGVAKAYEILQKSGKSKVSSS